MGMQIPLVKVKVLAPVAPPEVFSPPSVGVGPSADAGGASEGAFFRATSWVAALSLESAPSSGALLVLPLVLIVLERSLAGKPFGSASLESFQEKVHLGLQVNKVAIVVKHRIGTIHLLLYR